MKILFVNTNTADYLQDLIYSGLRKISSNIRDYPLNLAYHLNIRKYPKNLGYSRANFFKNLKAYFDITPKNADMVIVGSSHPNSFLNYLKIIREIPKSIPIVFVDGGDREEIAGDLIRFKCYKLWEDAIKIRPFDFIFKREYLKNKEYPDNVYPLPFSINPDIIEVPENVIKNKDVNFWAVNSHPVREKAFNILRQRFGDSDIKLFNEMKKYFFRDKEYVSRYCRYKIGISLRGNGWDTFRYWEIPYFELLMVTTDLDIVIPDDFQDGKHIIRCRSDLSDLIEICDYYLKNDLKRNEIIKSAKTHLLNYHTNFHRARYLIDIVRK